MAAFTQVRSFSPVVRDCFFLWMSCRAPGTSVGWLVDFRAFFFTDYSMFILLSLPKQSERGLLHAENFAKCMTFLRQTVNSWYTWLGWVRSNCLRLSKMMESSSLRWDVTTWVENSDRLLAASSSFSCVVRPLSGFDVILEPFHPVWQGIGIFIAGWISSWYFECCC